MLAGLTGVGNYGFMLLPLLLLSVVAEQWIKYASKHYYGRRNESTTLHECIGRKERMNKLNAPNERRRMKRKKNMLNEKYIQQTINKFEEKKPL